MIETILVMYVLLAMTPLIWRETQAWSKLKPLLIAELEVQFEAWGGNGFLGETVKRGVKSVVAERSAKEKEDRLKALKDEFKKIFADAEIESSSNWGEGTEHYPLSMKVKHTDLHAARRVLRVYFGSWNDMVDAVSADKVWDDKWENKIDVIVAKYKGTKPINDVWYQITTEYPIDNVPKGLLKEGCEIKEEVERSFKVVCNG